MRLWTLHPRYLDSRGLVALWREALLAQKVLAGGTRGYRRHPQLLRFAEQPEPATTIASYLREVAREAARRGYRFDESKIARTGEGDAVEATAEQLLFEWRHLMAKLRTRAPAVAVEHAAVTTPEPHPLFRIVPGPVADWERRQR
jgi:hypothetical protein